jgi:hypothetical protein
MGGWSFSGLRSLKIPASVEKIRSMCFYECDHLENVTFESGSRLKEMGGWSFSDTPLHLLEIPASVEKIENMCFKNCQYLRDITFESEARLQEVGKDVFKGCNALVEIRYASAPVREVLLPHLSEKVRFIDRAAV